MVNNNATIFENLRNKDIAFAAWKPTDRDEFNIYRVSLFIPEKNKTILLDEFKLSMENVWNVAFSLNWVTIPNLDYDYFTLQTYNKTEDKPVSNNWQFIFVLKDTGSDNYGIRENYNTNINYEYCTSEVKTNSKYKTWGAECPINPDTGKEMATCMNWRRLDFMGQKCKLIMTREDRNKSVENFCTQNLLAEDCACHNRAFLDEYKNANKKDDHDYCWYEPCKDGSRLILETFESIKCADNRNCQVIYNVEKVGNVNIKDTFLKCTENSPPSSSTSLSPSLSPSLYIYILVVVLVLIILSRI